MSPAFTGSVVEDAPLDGLQAAGWHIAHGPEIAPGGLPMAAAGLSDL